MMAFTLSRGLTLACFLLVPTLCHAHGCKIETASAPLHAAVGAGKVCSQTVEAKACVPSGKKPKSSSVRDLSASPSIDFSSEVKDAGGGCFEGKVTVRARNVMGPPFLQYCSEGSYDGRVEVAYCH
jgi:hypothetical protein